MKNYIKKPYDLNEKQRQAKLNPCQETDVSDLTLTESGKMVSGITDLVNSFDTWALMVDPNSIFASGSTAKFEAIGA